MRGHQAAVRHHTVAQATVMTLASDPEGSLVNAELRFSSRDPFAVRMLLSIDDSPAVEWVFARDLLESGLELPSGTGDVQIFPSPHGLVIDLISPNGHARLLADGADLRDFLDDVFEAVPTGNEDRFFSLDDELALLAESHTPWAAEG